MTGATVYVHVYEPSPLSVIALRGRDIFLGRPLVKKSHVRNFSGKAPQKQELWRKGEKAPCNREKVPGCQIRPSALRCKGGRPYNFERPGL